MLTVDTQLRLQSREQDTARGSEGGGMETGERLETWHLEAICQGTLPPL